MLGLRPPGLEFRILCLEDSVISFISPSPGGFSWPSFSLNVHKGGLKPDSFQFCMTYDLLSLFRYDDICQKGIEWMGDISGYRTLLTQVQFNTQMSVHLMSAMPGMYNQGTKRTANTILFPNAGLMLDQRRRLWAYIKLTSVQSIVFSGNGSTKVLCFLGTALPHLFELRYIMSK